MVELRAKLSRNRDKAICPAPTHTGLRECGEPIAAIHQIGQPEPRRLLAFTQGWVHEDGVWRLPKRARQRLLLGRSAYRRTKEGYSAERFEAHLKARGALQPSSLPTCAICPQCGATLILDADVLDVAQPDPPRASPGILNLTNEGIARSRTKLAAREAELMKKPGRERGNTVEQK